MVKRGPPKSHKVHTKHSRYKVKEYSRGKEKDFWNEDPNICPHYKEGDCLLYMEKCVEVDKTSWECLKQAKREKLRW